MLSKEVYCNSNVLQTGVFGRSLQPLGDFSSYFGKKAILILLDHISQPFESIQSHLKVLDF